MTIEDIADYCEFKNCRVSAGSADAGFIALDGGGVASSFNAYRRFLAHREMSSLASPHSVLEAADQFIVHKGGQERMLSRSEFERELHRFQELTGIAPTDPKAPPNSRGPQAN